MKQKTIFIALSSPAVFRNLFFFPQSFFERVKEYMRTHTELRVIFLVPPQFREKYGAFLKTPELGDRIQYEIITVPSRKSFLQKMFYFLYSYLIFTGTTKIMATMGTRPDEPPAGGRWYLAPAKIVIARTLGRIRWLKTVLVQALHLKIFTERPFQEIFTKYNPSVVFAPHLYGWFDTMLIAEAKRHGIKTVGMPAGWDHLDKYFLPFHVDTLLAQSEQVKRMATKHQAYNERSIVITGYPHFDFISRTDYRISREELLKSLNFPLDAKIILYVSGSAYCPDEPEIIDAILQWADEGKFGFDVRVIIRPYLGGRKRDKEIDEQKFNRFEENPRVRFYQLEFWGDLEKSIEFINIMNHSDVVISVYSTMVLEAAVLDRPLMAISFDGHHTRPYRHSIRRFEEFDHFQDVLKTGALKTARSFDDLFAFLYSYLHNPELDKEKRQKLRETVCYHLDGKASERVFVALIGSINTGK
ncbi:MAG: CDP-glycerol glycerophosphotransferase family protein [Patescibacteria group bacterium]